MRESFAPVNGFSAGLWLPLFGPGARRFEDDLLEVVTTDDDDREIQPAAFAHQPAADRLAGGRAFGDVHGIRKSVLDDAERCEVAAVVEVELGEREGGFAADELAGRGIDGVAPDPVVVQGLYPVDRHAGGSVETHI